jgi:hypothetical protein
MNCTDKQLAQIHAAMLRGVDYPTAAIDAGVTDNEFPSPSSECCCSACRCADWR